MSLVDQILGKGAVADFCLWENKKNSGITLVMATLFWFLLEIMETQLVPLLCAILMLLMLSLFLWAKFGDIFFAWRPPSPEAIKLLDSPLRALFSKIEGLLLTLYEISYGRDIKTFLLTIIYVAIVDAIGSYINLLTILYTCLLCSMTIPVFYLQFQEGIDSFIGNVSGETSKLFNVITSKVLNTFPVGTKLKKK